MTSSQNSSANVPIINRPETIIVVPSIALAIATVAVALRLYARIRVIKSPGLDDLFVLLAWLASTPGTVFVILQVKYGLGGHSTLLTLDAWEGFLMYFFASNLTYSSSTTLIKLSILFQYLRLFKESRIIRRLCYVMIAIVSLWGTGFFFAQLFTCSPVAHYWSRLTSGSCRWFGSTIAEESFAAYATHASTNMVLDILILGLPIPALPSLQMDSRRKSWLAGLYVLGAFVASVSVIRLYTIIDHKAATKPTYDITYWSSAPIVLSCVEVDIAIVCGSMPIFWPVLSAFNWKQFSKIRVVNEVEIRTESRRQNRHQLRAMDTRDGWDNGQDSGAEEGIPMGRKGSSVRSTASQDELRGGHDTKYREYYDWRDGELAPMEQGQTNIQGAFRT